jgi:O-antigen ligase
MRKAALLYTLGRFGLFAVLAVVVWGASGLLGHQLNGLPLLLVAALLSSVLGYVLFARQRQALAEALDARRQERAEQHAQQRARLENEP